MSGIPNPPPSGNPNDWQAALAPQAVPPVSPATPGPGTTPPPPRKSSGAGKVLLIVGGIVVALGVVLALIAIVVVFVLTSRSDGSAAPGEVPAVAVTSTEGTGGGGPMAGEGEPSLADAEKFGYLQVSASSEYPANRTYSYGPENAIDGDPATWWGEGADGDGHGESLQVAWTGTRQVSEVRLIPGYMKYEADKYGDRWTLNNRIRRAEIRLSSGRSFEHAFDDVKGWHTAVVDPPEDAEWVKVVILDTYPGYNSSGSRVRDSGISEIEVWGFE